MYEQISVDQETHEAAKELSELMECSLEHAVRQAITCYRDMTRAYKNDWTYVPGQTHTGV